MYNCLLMVTVDFIVLVLIQRLAARFLINSCFVILHVTVLLYNAARMVARQLKYDVI